MNLHECPRVGPYCITLRSPLSPRDRIVIDDEQHLLELPLTCDMTRQITPVSAVIEMLQDAEKSLQSVNLHPVDQSLVGVSSEELAQLQLVLARTPGRQRSALFDSLQEASSQEVQVAKEMAQRLSAVSEKITGQTASSEKVMETLHAEVDAGRARKVLWAQVKGLATVVGDGQTLVTTAKETMPTGNIAIRGQEAHQIQVDILRSDRECSAFKVKLLKCISHTPLFTPNDCGVQAMQLDVPDRAAFFLMSQCMTLGWPVAISASIDILLGARGIEYRATVLSITDAAALAQRLSTAVRTHTLDLFPT